MMKRETFYLVEEMIQQADAAHQEAEASLAAGGRSYEPGDATALALLALNWRVRAFLLAWLEMERPIQSPEKEPAA